MASARRAVVTAATVLVLLPALGAASPESRALTREGAAALAAKRFEEALGKFQAASQADPTDGEALFFQGVALNRLGRHGEALARFVDAAARRFAHSDAAFELGWAFLGLGQWNRAAALLEGYEKAHAGRGQTSEFLGRAYLGLRRWEQAEAKLEEAMARDAALRPSALFYLAQLEQARDRPEAARRHFVSLMRESPDSPLVRTLREQLARAAERERELEKPWHLVVVTSGGFNSNAIALGSDIPLPQDISSKRSGFARFVLDAGWNWRPGLDDFFALGFGFLADVYEAVPSLDTRDYVLTASWTHVFNPEVFFSLRLADEYTEIGGDRFRNEVSFRPALGFRFVDWLTVEAAGNFAFSDYARGGPRLLDRDARAATLLLTGYFRVPNTELQGRLGYFHTENDADGDEFEFASNGVQLALSYPLPWEITGDLVYVHTWDTYTQGSAFATPQFATRRRDDVDRVTVQLTRPVLDWLRVFARYDFVNDDSNIAVFRYHQHVWSGGLIFSF